MGQQGYPDFQRYVQASADPVFASLVFPCATNTEQGPFYVGNWSKLAVGAALNTAGAKGLAFTVRFYADQAKSLLVSTMAWASRSSVPITDQVAVPAGWVTFQLQETGGLVGDTATVILAPFLGTGANGRSFAATGLMSVRAQAVPNGTSAAAQAQWVTSGLFTVSVHVNEPTLNPYLDVQITGTDDTGVARVVYGTVLNTALLNVYSSEQVYLPGLWLNASLFNRSANPCTVDLSVVQAP